MTDDPSSPNQQLKWNMTPACAGNDPILESWDGDAIFDWLPLELLNRGTATLELPTKDTAEILGFSAKALQRFHGEVGKKSLVAGCFYQAWQQKNDPGEWYLSCQSKHGATCRERNSFNIPPLLRHLCHIL